MQGVLQDTRHALRQFRREPSFTAVVILTLGLATCVVAVVFSIAEVTLLRPLPYPQPEQLIQVGVQSGQQKRGLGRSPSLQDVHAFNAANAGFKNFAVRQAVFPDPVLDASVVERAKAIRVSEEYFELFGVVPAVGRLLGAGDVVPGAESAVVISNDCWQSRFGGEPHIVGRLIRIDGIPTTIVGVLPRSFGSLAPLWLPLQAGGSAFKARGSGWVVYGRLTEPISLALAAERLTGLLPNTSDGVDRSRVVARFMLDDVRSGYRTTVTILGGAVSVLLLLACVNVSGLLLARGIVRLPELAARASLGASQSRLIRQMLTESLILCIGGGLIGVGLSWLTLDVLTTTIGVRFPEDAPPRLDFLALTATGITLTIVGFLVGLLPAVRFARAGVGQLLTHRGHLQAVSLSRRGGQALVALEIALAVVTLAGAGLMLRSVSRLESVDLGFDPARVLVLAAQPIELKQSAYASYYPALVEAVAGLPGVEAVGAADSGPLGGGGVTRFRDVIRPDGVPETVIARTVLPGYFEALGVPLVAGRYVADVDRNSSAGVVVINDTAARQWFAGVSPVGRTLEINKAVLEIVGVVGNVRTHGPRGPRSPELYLPYQPVLTSRIPPSPFLLFIRPRPAAQALQDSVSRLATSTGPPAVIDSVLNGTVLFADTITADHQRTVLLAVLGTLGTLLALVGVLGVTSYAVSHRTGEIGVRLALGARPKRVVAMLLRDSIAAILVGLCVGIGGAFFATRVIRSFLFETSSTDPLTFGAVVVALGTIGCAAAWIPARRAARIDPIATLKNG